MVDRLRLKPAILDAPAEGLASPRRTGTAVGRAAAAPHRPHHVCQPPEIGQRAATDSQDENRQALVVQRDDPSPAWRADTARVASRVDLVLDFDLFNASSEASNPRMTVTGRLNSW